MDDDSAETAVPGSMHMLRSGRSTSGDLIVERPEGLYCPLGDFHIDPWRPVPRAVVTHAHADHASRGHGCYLASAASDGVLRSRLGADIALQTLDYGDTVVRNGVTVSLHPAGHVLGSAQVRIEHRGRVWVASGDYFVSGHDTDHNATCAPFEPVACHCFITESTFGLPIYRWRPQREIFADIDAWWRANADAGMPACCRATASARRSASWRASMRRSGRSSCTARSSP